jgi:L-aspartate oxidase
MAWRAGAELMDMEFYQFHPTAFAMEGAPRFLMSEALRGEGALLKNARGERFMGRYHKGLELAPRDVVARAIAQEMRDGPVYLDMRAVGAGMDLKARFPGISRFLEGYGLELARDLIPVGPAAHYLMGGIRTDLHGRSSLAGLYAAGEAACTGVHGANRLASNSLLEGLVFGALAAEAMVKEQLSVGSGELLVNANANATATAEEEGWIVEVREAMWRDAGLLRDEAGLRRAWEELERLRETCPAGLSRREVEARNLHAVAGVIVQAALVREESRGAHARSDFPQTGRVARHSIVRGRELWFEE